MYISAVTFVTYISKGEQTMATTKKNTRSTTGSVRVEYDYGTDGERRTKDFDDAAKAKKFIAAKERAGKNPKVRNARGKGTAKPKLKITAVTEVDLGPGTTHATDEQTKRPRAKMASKKPTALQELEDLWAAGEYRKALKLAASWPRLGEHKDAIRGGWDATVNGRVHREMGKDPDTMYAAGLAAVAARYGLPPAPAEDAPGTTTSGTTKKPTTDKAKEQTKKAAPKKPTVPGVRPVRTRPYLAGVIIAKYGLAAGVTGAMVAELDEAYGKPNPTESQFCLKNAWHAVRGYLDLAEGAEKSILACNEQR
jgi:hypothetical protein